MHFSRSFIASALLGFVAATTHEASLASASPATALAASALSSGVNAAATGVPSGMVATHVIQVGGPNGSVVFLPDSITANPGDLVQFQFNPKNHSVVQSTFDQPCVPIQNIMPNKTDAFFSGFMPAGAAAAGEQLTYTIRVMDTKPIWFYCSQAKHCQAGMVGAINAAPTGNKTVSAFKQLAAAAQENLSPGQGAGQGSGQGSGQSSGQGSAAQSSGAAGGSSGSSGSSGATGTAGAAASSTASGSTPAEQSTGASPGRVSQSFAGLGLAGLAAVFML